METLDPATEWLRLSEHYRQMTDDELLALGRQISGMTEVAQQVLGHEISKRKLELLPESPPAPPIPEPPPDGTDAPDPYAKDRKLVEIRTVWSLSDALQLQALLDTAGIPFYLGPEKATRVDPGTLNFVNGISVQVMQVGLPWAHQAMKHYAPSNEPPAEKDEQQNNQETLRFIAQNVIPRKSSSRVWIVRRQVRPTTPPQNTNGPATHAVISGRTKVS